jgi:hypothetical protein
MDIQDYYKKYFGLKELPDKLGKNISQYSYKDLVDFAEYYADIVKKETISSCQEIIDTARHVDFNVKEICLDGISLNINKK